jgi:ABC-2 type transport system ATP-binding protein
VSEAILLRIASLRKEFKGAKGPVVALREVSFDVAPGETVSLLGPNGAGKTTLMKITSGLLIPDAGLVEVAGSAPYANAAALRRVGSLLEGSRNLYWKLTPRENLAYFGALKGMRRRDILHRGESLLEEFGLAGKADEPVQALSRGMQQKLAIACTILHNPALLLLDEPTLSLDAASSMQLLDMIRALARDGMTILISTHQLDIAETLADKIVILDNGRVIRAAATGDLIRSFSRDCYEIRVAGVLPPQVAGALRERLGATLAADGCVTIPGDCDRLYAALDLLRPVPIVAISRHRADLSGIFMQLTGSRTDVH